MAGSGVGNDKLTTPQRRAISALLASRSVEEAAKTAGVGVRTLYRWLERPAFRAALAAAEGELIDAATRRLLQHQEHALTVVLAIMADRGNAPSVRLRAAQTVIDSMLKLRELRNVEERLARLEAMLGGSTR